MKRYALVPFLVVAAACPGEKKKDTAQIPVDSTTVATDSTKTDTTSGDLSKIAANLPTVAPDTFRARTPAPNARVGGSGVGSVSRSSFPDAPAPLVEAVQREQGATRFCYTEFGQKADPSLRGNVAMLVTIGRSGVSDASVADANWTGTAGRAVNRCLDQKAKLAWNVSPGAVKPGKYIVQLSFSGAQ
jgi:hypothetical protein